MAVNEQKLFDNDYSFLDLPESGSAVRDPINIAQDSLPANIIAAINKVAPTKLPEMDTPLNFDPFDQKINNEGLIGSQNFSEFFKQTDNFLKALEKEKLDLSIALQKAIAENDALKAKETADKIQAVEVEIENQTVPDAVTDLQDNIDDLTTDNEIVPEIVPEPLPEIVPEIVPEVLPEPLPERVAPFVTSTPIQAQLEQLSNPTAAMYSSDPGISGVGTYTPTGDLGSGSGKELLDMSIYPDPTFGNPDALGNIQADLASALENAASVDATLAQLEKSMPPTVMDHIKGGVGAVVKAGGNVDLAILNTIVDKVKAYLKGGMEKQTKKAAVKQLKGELANRGGPSSLGLHVQKKGSGAQGAASAKAEAKVPIGAALSAFSLNPAAYLYGGAGSSFESGRDEYTESGQYDIDREARQAEFDAMREQRRIDAGLPSKKLTQDETQQAIKDLQGRVGFGGVMTAARGRDNTPLNMDELAITDPVRFNAIMGSMGPSQRPPINNPSPFMGIPGQGQGRGGIRSIRRG